MISKLVVHMCCIRFGKLGRELHHLSHGNGMVTGEALALLATSYGFGKLKIQ